MCQAIKKQWILCCYALSFFSRVPVPKNTDFKAYPFHLGNAYFPLVGLLYAFLSVAAYSLAVVVFNDSISVVLMLMGGVLFTGALHEDGLADCADGFGGGYHKAQRLAIMKDSQIGAYGVLALIFLFVLKLLTFIQLAEYGLGALFTSLLCAAVLSRASALVLIQCSEYARQEQSSKSTLSSQALPNKYFCVAIALSLLTLTLLPWSSALMILLLISLSTFCCRYYFHRTIDGYTGDCLGFLQQLNELLIALVLLANLS